MGKRWTVIVVTLGDSDPFGHRVQSIIFNTLAAADQAAVFFKNAITDCKLTIVEDWA